MNYNPAQFLPATGPNRSTTAANNDQAAVRDGYVYSAIVLAQGATGVGKMFTVPQGQGIPELKGSSITATTQPHQVTFTELTTNLAKAGETGSSIGDLAIRSIGYVLEAAAFDETASPPAYRAWGFTPVEVTDILTKVSFEFKIAGTKQAEGPLVLYPGQGGIAGGNSASTTATSTTLAVGTFTNGIPGSRRGQQFPIPVSRTDTIVNEIKIAAGDALSFATGRQSGAGQPGLVWCVLDCLIKGDVRG